MSEMMGKSRRWEIFFIRSKLVVPIIMKLEREEKFRVWPPFFWPKTLIVRIIVETVKRKFS